MKENRMNFKFRKAANFDDLKVEETKAKRVKPLKGKKARTKR